MTRKELKDTKTLIVNNLLKASFDYVPLGIALLITEQLTDRNILYLPFNVGDSVYAWCENESKVLCYEITEIRLIPSKDNIPHYVYYADSIYDNQLVDSIDFDLADINVRVFSDSIDCLNRFTTEKEYQDNQYDNFELIGGNKQ